MKLSNSEQANFHAYIRLHVLHAIDRLIPEYINTHPHLNKHLEDYGYEAVEEALIADADELTIHWND